MTLAFHTRPNGKPFKQGSQNADKSRRRRVLSPLHYVDREADVLGVRYEMIPLPDRMCDTTVFVGNFCEFVYDDDLSHLFQVVSASRSPPACVIRKANMQSLRYGFVSFLSVAEKEAAILRFHNTEWRGKRIKVECIIDNPKCGRVRVPERMVSYVSGSLKKNRSGKVNSMRAVRDGKDPDDPGAKKRRKKAKIQARRKAQALKKERKQGRIFGFNLSPKDQAVVLRAAKHGFLTLDGRNAGHGSLANLCSSEALKGSKLAQAHRDWCDARAKPNIVLYKASGRHSREVLDHVVVDLSPLRGKMSSKWMDEIMDAAVHAGMKHSTTEEEETSIIDEVDSESSGAREPISDLPFVSSGVFVGERSKAKAMAKELAQMWELPELEEYNEADEDSTYVPSGHERRYQNNHGKTGKDSQHKRRAKRRRIKSEDWENMGRYLRY